MKRMPRNINAGFLGAFVLLMSLFNHAQAAATLSSIEVLPNGATLVAGQSQSFTANGIFSNSSTPQTLTPVVTAIAAGSYHNCVVLISDAVQCWGSNNYGQLGNNSTANSSIPVTVSGLGTATAVAAAYGHSCTVLADGAVRCWGYNSNGQLGNGTTTASTTPVAVLNLSGNATAIAAGYSHSCALLAGGAVKCWGDNAYGQLGNNTTVNSSIPVTVVGLSGTATAVAAGWNHSCALLAGGVVQCWGANTYGQLGNNSTTHSSIPVTVGLSGTATAIALGWGHSCALLADGTLRCWGDNQHGELGDGLTVSSNTPVSVSLISNATAIAAGMFTNCATLADGTVQCWGDNTYGQVGNNSSYMFTSPVTVSGVSSASLVAAGIAHSCTLLGSGAVQCWGNNAYDQLGDGTTSNSITPVAVGKLHAVMWSSSNPTVATINADGLASAALSLGTTTITATAGGIIGSTILTVSPTTYTLSTATTGTGSGTVSGGGTYSYGVTAPVSATANASSTFIGWTGPYAAECATGSVLMKANKICTATFAITTPPDLAIDSLMVVPNPVALGQPVTITATVRNKGMTAANNFTIDLYKNLFTKPTVGQVGDVTCNVASLAGGATTTCSHTVSYDTKGAYKVRAQVDTMNAVAETNEKNNLKGSILVMVKNPDLWLIKLTASTTTPTVGQEVTLTTSVMNFSLVSTGAFEVDLYRNLADAPGVSQVGDVTCNVSGLAKLAMATCTGKVTYAAPGTYQIWAQADTMNAMAERSEVNNAKGPIKVTVH